MMNTSLFLKLIVIQKIAKKNISDLYPLRLNNAINSNTFQRNRGYTLIELLIVILLLGTLSAIAVPGWLAFINNQRLRTSIDRVYAAMQLAQSNAKRDKVAWQASFRVSPTTGLVQWLIYPASTNTAIGTLPEASDSSFSQGLWYSLESNVQIDTTETNLLQPSSGIYTAIFNRQGCLVKNSADGCADDPPDIPQKIKLQHTELGSARRCVVVSTLLGAMRVGNSVDECKN